MHEAHVEVEHQDRKLCWIYGSQFREFFPDKAWADVELIMKLGWERIRRDSRIDWHQAMPHIKAGWEDALSPHGSRGTTLLADGT